MGHVEIRLFHRITFSDMLVDSDIQSNNISKHAVPYTMSSFGAKRKARIIKVVDDDESISDRPTVAEAETSTQGEYTTHIFRALLIRIKADCGYDRSLAAILRVQIGEESSQAVRLEEKRQRQRT
jgi:hypothetical protein